jgi:hypothetical protein
MVQHVGADNAWIIRVEIFTRVITLIKLCRVPDGSVVHAQLTMNSHWLESGRVSVGGAATEAVNGGLIWRKFQLRLMLERALRSLCSVALCSHMLSLELEVAKSTGALE